MSWGEPFVDRVFELRPGESVHVLVEGAPCPGTVDVFDATDGGARSIPVASYTVRENTHLAFVVSGLEKTKVCLSDDQMKMTARRQWIETEAASDSVKDFEMYLNMLHENRELGHLDELVSWTR